MTVIDLVFLAGITFGALLLATSTPEPYRPKVYLAIFVVWGFVLLYLMAPDNFLNQQLRHWTK